MKADQSFPSKTPSHLKSQLSRAARFYLHTLFIQPKHLRLNEIDPVLKLVRGRFGRIKLKGHKGY